MKLLALVVVLAACGEEMDPQWQLDHDRIVAIRANPPGITSGTSTLDGIVAFKDGKTLEMGPDLATVIAPQALAGALANQGGVWTLTFPSEPELVAAREELKLPAGSQVPVTIGVAYAAKELAATKTIFLGVDVQNPTTTVESATIDEQSMTSMTELAASLAGETHFAITAAEDDDVNWLTSCGTLHDFDLPKSYLTIEEEDKTEGELAVVVRTQQGGVAWRVWPIKAQ